MKTTLFYFSGTGNSLAVARDLAAALGETEIVRMDRVAVDVPVDLSADRIGFVFPVYMWGLPLIVARFLRRIRDAQDRYYFAVATYGGSPGATLRQAAAVLSENGNTLAAGFAVRMPGNYTPMYGAFAPKKQQKFFDKEKARIPEIAAAVREGKQVAPEVSNPLVNWLLSKHFYSFAAPHIPEMDKSFWVEDKCTGCGTCAKACPAGNIVMEKGRPSWQHRCEQCMACLQWCPECALQYGKAKAGIKLWRVIGSFLIADCTH
jgi:ferredoxin